jgi:hypothetical protein
MPGKVTFTTVKGIQKGAIFVFAKHDTFLCGRQEDNHMCLQGDKLVSRHHCILEINPPDVRIRDLGSRNGTFIDGKKYGGRPVKETPEEGAMHQYPSVNLRDGSKVGIGKTLLLVSVEAPELVTRRLICQRCQSQLVVEVEPEQQGTFICDSCRHAAQSDPKMLFEQVQANVPEIIPGYLFLKELGKGGMGAVYLIQHVKNGRLAALKVMLPQMAVDEDAQLRFLREIETTRALQHRNIVKFIDGGIQNGAFYFLLEYCECGNLHDLLVRRGGKLSLKEAGPIMLQVLEGLAYAHAKGFIHRDLKPQNILLSGQEGKWTARVSDLGLAKSFEEAGFSGMTVTGEGFIGSLSYMPREQIINYKYIKPVSDVWAIGATCYHLLTGHLPRVKREGEDTLNMILHGASIPLLQRNPHIPPAIAAVIDRSLAIHEESRYQDAGEMHKALAQALKEGEQN